MPAEVEARVVGMRRAHPGWGPSRIRWELERMGVVPLPGRSAVYRARAPLVLRYDTATTGRAHRKAVAAQTTVADDAQAQAEARVLSGVTSK